MAPSNPAAQPVTQFDILSVAGLAAPNLVAQPQGGEGGKHKKKRTTNPGVRVQGGRIYDSETGTTCHQCRQKTVEVKAKCGKCTLWWCPRCLENRYGEQVAQVSQLEQWPCPRCRDICNCSNCRKKRGLEATGILANMSKAAGFASVSALLEVNLNAKRPPPPPAAPRAPKPAKSASQAPAAPKEKKPKEPKPRKEKAPKEPKPPKEKALKEKKQKEAFKPSGPLPDYALGKRPAPMPEPEELAVHAPAGPRRARIAAWVADLPRVTPLPAGACAGDLVEVLEFLQVFDKPLKLRLPSLAALAAELMQPVGPVQLGSNSDSIVADVHIRLLDLVRGDWGLKGTVGRAGWQAVMAQYLAQGSAPTTAAGRTPAHSAAMQEKQKEREGMTEGNESPQRGAPSPAVAAEVTAAGAEGDAVAAPSFGPGGYWGCAPGVRLRMLRHLCWDALDTALLRAHIEDAMEAAAEAEKGRREELAAARKGAREEAQRQRDAHIAALLTNASSKALTLEEQKALMRTGAAAAAPKAAALAAAAPPPPCVRGTALGRDRDAARYWRLQAGAVLTGEENALLVQRPFEGAAAEDGWGVIADPAAVARAVDGRGVLEGPLRVALAAAFSFQLEPQAHAGGEAGADDDIAGVAAGGGAMEDALSHDASEADESGASPQRTTRSSGAASSSAGAAATRRKRPAGATPSPSTAKRAAVAGIKSDTAAAGSTSTAAAAAGQGHGKIRGRVKTYATLAGSLSPSSADVQRSGSLAVRGKRVTAAAPLAAGVGGKLGSHGRLRKAQPQRSCIA